MPIVPIDVTIQKACLGLLFCFLTHCVWKVLASPLNTIPGPFLASKYIELKDFLHFVCMIVLIEYTRSLEWTNLWRLFDVWGGRCELTQKLLHEKYGPVVRLGPNSVSLGDPELIGTLYGIKKDWLKVWSSGCMKFFTER